MLYHKCCAIALAVFNILISSKVAHAGITSGSYRGSESWVFLDKFVFNSRAVSKSGYMDGRIIYPADEALKLMVYFLGDSSDSEFTAWENIYNGDYTCEEKLEQSNYNFDLQEQRFFTRSFTLDGRAYKEVTVKSSFDTSRPRWFFIAVGNCMPDCDQEYCSAGVDIEYQFNLTNGGGIDMYFSADEQGILQINIFYTVMYTLLAAYSLKVRDALVKIRKYHTTVVLAVASMWFSLLSVLANTVSFGKYSVSGYHLAGIRTIASVAEGGAEFTALLHVILIAKGWTIVRRKISANGRVRIAVYMTFYVSWYWACMVYYQYGVGKESITYVFDTWPGHGVVALRCYAFLWLHYAIRVTVRKYKVKKRFYFKYLISVGAWILAVPAFVLLNWGLSEYQRERLMHGLYLTSMYLLHVNLIVLYNPDGPAKKMFPFHATTTAMLAGRRAVLGEGNNMKDSHLRQAAALSQRIRSGVSALEKYTLDLNDFLEAVDPSDDFLANEDEDLEVAGSQVGMQKVSGGKSTTSVPVQSGTVRLKRNLVPPMP